MKIPHGLSSRFPDRPSVSLYGFSIFAGAFLLFLLQPMVGKRILPWFGGGASVWATCLIFFQGFLLAGYYYAHRLSSARSRRWIWLHMTLLAVSLLLMPILPSEFWKPTSADHPVTHILALLGGAIGLPYFLLTSTSPLIQSWLAEEHPQLNPYRFYALSNLGSMLALVVYPTLIEPWLTLRLQSWLWTGLFTCYLAAMLRLSLHRARNHEARIDGPRVPEAGSPVRVPSGMAPLWVLLAALPSALLISVTSHLTTNVAPIPLLWIMPLGLYLLSFILCFDHPRWYRRTFFLVLFPVALVILSLLISEQRQMFSVWKAIPVAGACFFVICMVAHGELAASKPASDRITSYYLLISLGGCLGGVFSGLLAPMVFKAQYEILWVLILLPVVPIVAFARLGHPCLGTPLRRIALGAGWGLALVAAAAVMYQRWQMVQESVTATRSFYGSLRVIDEGRGEEQLRSLIDGNIDHGSQYLHPTRKAWITTYFGPGSGVSFAFQALEAGPRRVAVVGLGAGTLASYGRTGDVFHFFEINPDAVAIARKDFSYLGDCPAQVEVFLGDGRLSMEAMPVQGYDMIILDAFTSDAVPVHLLTREAFELYFRQLKPNGIICVNISNRYLDLVPVIARIADEFGRKGRVIRSNGDLAKGVAGSSWVVLMDGSNTSPRLEPVRAQGGDVQAFPGRALWADDHSNLFSIIRWAP